MRAASLARGFAGQQGHWVYSRAGLGSQAATRAQSWARPAHPYAHGTEEVPIRPARRGLKEAATEDKSCCGRSPTRLGGARRMPDTLVWVSGSGQLSKLLLHSLHAV